MLDPTRLRAAYTTARDALLAQRTTEGYWEGELSSSALSTATAVAALAMVARSGRESHQSLIENGLRWLTDHQNPEGGWGDTVKSVSNISTTMLCRAAFHIAGKAEQHENVLAAAMCWLEKNYAERSNGLAAAVRRRYGADRTFSVPILMTCALAGQVPWNEVTRLPFELACLPQSWYRLARMPVVSYALPALIAIGQVVHHFRPTRNPLKRLMRWLARRRSLRVLERIQPSSGGYLEATPLTSFVVMSLAAIGFAPPFPAKEGGTGGLSSGAASEDLSRPHIHAPPSLEGKVEGPADRVIARGVEFLVRSVRPDGSWPIDSNLSIWVTTLAVNALAAANNVDSLDRREVLLCWLLDQQSKDVHPYTGAAAGAWGWSHLPGSVPDCDDTPGALLAVRALAGDVAHGVIDEFVLSVSRRIKLIDDQPRLPDASGNLGFHVLSGLGWVRDLRNSDGGWPTFCRGWGKLPFDRSGSDLTAHAIRAFAAWREPSVPAAVAGTLLGATDLDVRAGNRPVRFVSRRQFREAIASGLQYLAAHQRADGSWLPLWFGNQHAPDDANPVYGTARVLAAYRDLARANNDEACCGVAYLLSAQNADGGWGGAKGTPSSVEETALAVEVLIDLALDATDAIERGIEYLVRRVEDGTFTDPSPIGFYFAKLWYFEKLYPIIFTVAALGRAVRRLESR